MIVVQRVTAPSSTRFHAVGLLVRNSVEPLVWFHMAGIEPFAGGPARTAQLPDQCFEPKTVVVLLPELVDPPNTAFRHEPPILRVWCPQGTRDRLEVAEIRIMHPPMMIVDDQVQFLRSALEPGVGVGVGHRAGRVTPDTGPMSSPRDSAPLTSACGRPTASRKRPHSPSRTNP